MTIVKLLQISQRSPAFPPLSLSLSHSAQLAQMSDS